MTRDKYAQTRITSSNPKIEHPTDEPICVAVAIPNGGFDSFDALVDAIAEGMDEFLTRLANKRD